MFSGDTKSIWFIAYENCMRIFNLLHEAWLDLLCVLAFLYVSKSPKKEYFVGLRDQSPQL